MRRSERQWNIVARQQLLVWFKYPDVFFLQRFAEAASVTAPPAITRLMINNLYLRRCGTSQERLLGDELNKARFTAFQANMSPL